MKMPACGVLGRLSFHAHLLRDSRTVLGLLSAPEAGLVTSWLQMGQACTTEQCSPRNILQHVSPSNEQPVQCHTKRGSQAGTSADICALKAVLR